MIILSIIMLVAFIATFFVDTSDDTQSVKNGLKISRFILVAGSLIFGFISSYYSVPAGHRGVLLQFGAVKDVLGEGMHFIIPGVQKVSVIEVRTQKEDAKASAASKDLQNVSTNVAINYHLDPLEVGKLYKNVGLNFASRIIDPATQETVKAVVANYTAEELIRLRSKVKKEIDETLTKRLSAYNITVEVNGVSLTNFEFSEDYNKAIEQKQVAQQAAEKSKYELIKAEIDAKTAIAKAEGEAKSNTIKATALNTMGGSKVLAREWIEKWDGKLPKVMTNNGAMMFNLGEIMKEDVENK